MIVNEVDTDRLRRAARQLRAYGTDVTMPPKAAADWLDHVATFAEAAELGQWIPGLQLAGSVARTVAGVDLLREEDALDDRGSEDDDG